MASQTWEPFFETPCRHTTFPARHHYNGIHHQGLIHQEGGDIRQPGEDSADWGRQWLKHPVPQHRWRWWARVTTLCNTGGNLSSYLCIVIKIRKGLCHGNMSGRLSAGLNHVHSLLQSSGTDLDQVPHLWGDDTWAGDHTCWGGGPPARLLWHKGSEQVWQMPAESDHHRM